MAKTPIQSCSKLPFFESISKQDLESLLFSCELISLKRGKTLFSNNTPATHAYVVVYGSLKMIKKTDSGERIIEFFGRNRLVGAPLMRAPESVYPLSGVCLEDSVYIKVSRNDFLNLWLKNERLSKKINEQTLKTIYSFHEAIGSTTESVPQRIAILFFRLLDGQFYESTSRIMVRLTRQDIANAIGATVETIIRVVSQWTKQGWIETIDHHIEIKNKKALKSILNQS